MKRGMAQPDETVEKSADSRASRRPATADVCRCPGAPGAASRRKLGVRARRCLSQSVTMATRRLPVVLQPVDRSPWTKSLIPTPGRRADAAPRAGRRYRRAIGNTVGDGGTVRNRGSRCPAGVTRTVEPADFACACWGTRGRPAWAMSWAPQADAQDGFSGGSHGGGSMPLFKKRKRPFS